MDANAGGVPSSSYYHYRLSSSTPIPSSSPSSTTAVPMYGSSSSSSSPYIPANATSSASPHLSSPPSSYTTPSSSASSPMYGGMSSSSPHLPAYATSPPPAPPLSSSMSYSHAVYGSSVSSRSSAASPYPPYPTPHSAYASGSSGSSPAPLPMSAYVQSPSFSYQPRPASAPIGPPHAQPGGSYASYYSSFRAVAATPRSSTRRSAAAHQAAAALPPSPSLSPSLSSQQQPSHLSPPPSSSPSSSLLSPQPMGSSSSLSLSAPAYSMGYAPSSSSSSLPSSFPSSSMSTSTSGGGGGYGPSSTTGAAPPPPTGSSYYSPYPAGPPSAVSSSGYGYAASSYASPTNNPSTSSSSTHTYPPYYYASYSPYPLSASTPSPSRHAYSSQPSPSDPNHGVVPLGPSSLSLPAPTSASVASGSTTSRHASDFGDPMSIDVATTQQQQRPQRRTSPQRSGAEIPLPQLEAYPSIMSPRMPSPPSLSSGSEPSAGVPPAVTASATDTGGPPQSVQGIKREAAPDGSAPKTPRKRTTNSLVKSLSEAKNGKPRANTTTGAGVVVPHGAGGDGEDSDNEGFTMVHEWTDIDDAILLAAIHASASIEDVVRKGYLTNHFTAEEIKARWRAILYDQSTAEACAARLAEIEFDLPLLAYLEQQPPYVTAPEKPGHEPPPSDRVRGTAEVDASSHAPPGTSAAASSSSLSSPISTSTSTSTSAPLSFTNEELDGLRFSEMEAKLLAAAPHSTLDFFSRIARKEAYWREGERVQEQILRLENELKLITEKKLKMLALLRGRYLRYEMKSKEIVLGRTAGDAVVDVDLSEEGDTAKISRRQAVIKLKRDGEFYVHNVGRATMFVNGRSVPTGKRMHLTHCCLVEVRQIAFIFEINRSLHAKLKAGLTAITTSSLGAGSTTIATTTTT